ncbi:MAG: aspartate--tRNA ligase [Desulfobacteraceae bacterium]
MSNWRERSYCGDLRRKDEGRKVLLMGWVDAVRDHGNLLFIHLRDARGIVQVVFDPGAGEQVFEKAERLRNEYVVEVQGLVALRSEGTENPNLETGDIEVNAQALNILAESPPLPFPISEKAMVLGEETTSSPAQVDEDLRLRFRYLDLRRPSMNERLVKRSRIMSRIRSHLEDKGFIEVETPFLTRSTPEGARDYLVPSRVHPGRFYALPQSPQLFKQLLIMSGVDRYFQIVRCFRDEDLRPNRQPEFTQLDLEAAFIDEGFIYEVVEELVAGIFEVGGIKLQRPFPRMSYHTAMERYGTDRPDLRLGMPFEEATDIFRGTGYEIFRRILDQGGLIKGFLIKRAAGSLSKNVLQNDYALKIAPSLGGKGMTWMKMSGGSLQSNISQFFTAEELYRLAERLGADEGDVVMMVADTSRDLVNKVLAGLRLDVAERLDRVPHDRYLPLWITEFPLFELKDDVLGSQHHPFTMPDREDFDPENMDEVLALRSRAYDLVINGEELGGGSIRIHRPELQQKVFQALGLTEEQVEGKFGFFVKALEYGAPPHGGLALGLDRVAAMVLGASSIRDVIAFPKNRSAVCPLTRAPSPADPEQLRELHLIFSDSAAASVDKDAGRSTSRAGMQGRIRISREEAAHVARLSRLRLTEEEVETFREDLSAVLDYMESIRDLDTEEVEPMSHVLESLNVWREDEEAPVEDPASILSGAPESENGYFKVPKILEG